jgi:hypothetical protein
MNDINQQLRDYLSNVIEHFDVENLPEMLHDTGFDDQPTGMNRVPAQPPRRRAWLVAVAAAVAVLLVLGGSTIFLDVFRASAPATDTTPTTEAISTTTTTLQFLVAPTTVARVTIDVPISIVPGLGALTWERVDGDNNSVPMDVQKDPNGGYMSVEDGKVWHSDDAITWTTDETSPQFEGYEAFWFEGDWAIGWDRDESQLFAREGDAWVPMDLPAGSKPETTGITWHHSIRIPVDSGGVTVIDGTTWGQVSWGDVYGTIEMDCGQPEPCVEEPWGTWDAPSETFRVEDPRTGGSLAVLTMAVDGNVISFVDTDTGETVHTITGSDDLPADVIAERLRRDSGLSYAGAWVAADGPDFTWVAFPWERADEILVMPSGGFVAFEFVYDWQSNPNKPLVSASMWTSANGVDWVEHDAPPFVDLSADHIGVTSSDTQLKATVITGYDESTGRESADTWVSTDGFTWTQIDTEFPPFINEQRTDFGWVASDAGMGFQFWVSTDGSTWFEVAGPSGSAEPEGPGGGYGGSGGVGSILFGAVGSDVGPRTLWIGTFESAP